MDTEESSGGQGIASIEANPFSSNKENVSSLENDGIPPKEFPLAWKELLSGTAIDTDAIEEGPLSDLEETQSFSGTHESPLSRSDWKEFVSDPSISIAEGGMNAGKFGQSFFSDDAQTRNHRDWTKLLSTSHLVEGEPSFKMTPLSLKTDEESKRHEVTCSSNSLVDTRQTIMPDIGGKSSITHMNSLAAINLPQPSDVVARTSSIPKSQTSGNLPVRPLTIGDSMTIGNSLGYHPVSPFTPDGNPPQTASSTPVIPTLPSMSHVSEGAIEAERDDPGDMTARERLQPLGRDGLEVKQGPPWGVTIPLFQPHSRKSSFSSNDSGSSHGSTSFFRPQTTSAPTTKPDAESSQLGLSVALSDGPLSRRSSLRSVGSKEPMAAKVFNSSETPNISVGKFHPLKLFEGDVDSPVSKILGPAFKTTQKMLEELQRRPLGVFHDSVGQQREEEDVTQKILTKENEGLSHDGERVVERKDKSLMSNNQRSVRRAFPENKHADHRTSDLFEINHDIKSKSVDNSNQLPSTDLKTKPDFQEGSKVNSIFPELSQYGDSQRLVEEDKERSLFSKTETPKTSRITDSTLGNSVAISENVHPSSHVINGITRGKRTGVETTDVAGQESLSWENVLEMHSTSGEMSEFDRVASESISWSNALASRFREELRSVDLRNDPSDDEGILDDETISGEPRDSAGSESTTNEDIYRPKGLVPLSNQRGPIGIYDIRMSSGPGSTDRKRLALGKLPREITQPSLHGGVYVSEGATGTEIEDRGVESEPEGQSTPKSDDVTRIGSNNDDDDDDDDEMVDLKSVPPKFSALKDGNITKKSGYFVNVRPSATVEHTWSISKPVMSQLDTKRTPVVKSGAKQESKQRTRDEQQSVYSSEKGRKRTSRHRKHGRKSSKSVKEHSNFSESSECSPPDTSRETKKSLADIILENFRREEKQQQRRLKKLEELKQNKPAPDLNALWDRFQEFVRKNYKDTQSKNSRQRLRSTSPQRTPFSGLSVASSSDIPFTEDKSPDQTVNLSTDSSEELEKFLRRVRQVQSSDTGSVVSRGSSDSHPRRQHKHWSTPIPRVNQVSVLSSTDQITATTSEEPSEPEPTFSLPMWLGVNTKHPKKKQTGASAPKITSKSASTVCTCGGRERKIKSTKASATVRDVGVNCPTPPVISRELNTVDVAALKIKTLEESQSNEAAPPSLLKLTLQDAFMYSKHDFIRRSRERIKNIKDKREEESADVVVIPSDKKTSKREKVKEDEAKAGISKPLKLYEELQQRKPRQMTQKEIRDVNKRIYKKLPEVKKKNDEDRKFEFYKTNRLRAKLYGKHVRNNLNRMYTAA